MPASDVSAIPEAARLIHIGPHKTGSTAIQVSLHKAREDLAEHGVHYAGDRARPRLAGWALGIAGSPAGQPTPSMEHWHALVREVEQSGSQRVCVSNEDFGRATPEQAQKVVAGLGSRSAHVVAVARRLDLFLPSQWQERVKAGQVKSFEEWLEIVLAPESKAWDWTNVWRAHAVETLVRRWIAEVGNDNFTLIVSDDTDRDLLPRTFEQLLGLPEGLLALHPDRSNRGLSWNEVELVRSLNMASRDAGWPPEVHAAFVKDRVVRTLRSLPRPEFGARTPPLPEWALDRVRELSDARVVSLAQLDIRVVGDLELLRVPASADDDEPSVDCPPIPVEVAARTIESVISEANKRQKAAQKTVQKAVQTAAKKAARKTAHGSTESSAAPEPTELPGPTAAPAPTAPPPPSPPAPAAATSPTGRAVDGARRVVQRLRSGRG
ncbi:MAG: hypothetical protein ACR2HA_07320 [Nocardioides sp.]